MSIADKLRKVLEIKNDIKASLEEVGVEVTDDFSTYATEISNLSSGEPEIPEIPKHEDVYAEALASIPELEPWVQPSDWIDLRTVLAENVIEGYPYRIALLIRNESEIEYLGAYRSSKYLIKTSDGTIINEADYDGSYVIQHTWTNDSDNGYRWIIYYSSNKEIMFCPFERENVVHIVFDGIRANLYHYNGSRYKPVEGSGVVTSKSSEVSFKNVEAMESINGATIFAYNTNYYTYYNTCFRGCFKLVYISPDILDDEFFYSKPIELFNSCKSLKYLPNIANKIWNKGNSTSFGGMFRGCSSLTTIPPIDTSNGTSFGEMFYGCSSLVTIPPIDTSNGTSFEEMFESCSSLITIPELNTSNGTDFDDMFYYCESLKTIPNLSINIDKATVSSMFTKCVNLEAVSYEVVPIRLLYNSGGIPGLKYINILDCTGITSFKSSFSIGEKIEYIGSIINIPPDLTSFAYMFYGCESLKTIPPIDTSNGTNFSYMFHNCKSLVTIPELNTSNGTNFSYMFYYCESLKTIPPIDTFNGTDFSYMCRYCSSLKKFGDLITSPDNSVVFNYMFYNCELDEIKSINVPLASSVRSMFGTANKVGSISSTSATSDILPSNSYIEVDEIHLPNLSGRTISIKSKEKIKFRGNVSYGVNFGFKENSYLIPTIKVIEIEPNTLSAEWELTNYVCLSYQSIINVFNALVQLEEGTVKTIKIESIWENMLTTEDISIAINKGWTVSFNKANSSGSTSYV